MKYKVVETLHGQFVGIPRVEVKFEGSLLDLNTTFPLSVVAHADPFDHKEIEEGYVQWDYTFYKSKDGLNWEECEDPRTYTDRHMTDFERAIDKENRGIYPGDYIEDNDYYQDYELYHQDEDDDLRY